MVVPIDYVVSPEDTRYPQMCRGCHLGRVVRDIKAGYRLRQHREDLAAMGFTFQSKTQLRIEKTMEAITLYKAMYGHVEEELCVCVGAIIIIIRTIMTVKISEMGLNQL